MIAPAELSVPEAAAVLGVHRTRIYQLLTEGHLTRGPLGGIDALSITTYRDNRRGPGRPRKEA